MSVIVGSRWRSNEADSGGREFFVCRDKALNANMVVTGNQRERQRGLSTTGPLISSILVIAPVQTQDALARGWSSCGSNDIGPGDRLVGDSCAPNSNASFLLPQVKSSGNGGRAHLRASDGSRH